MAESLTEGQDASAHVVDVFAREFVEQESGHIAELKRWIAARKTGKAAPAVN